MVKFKIGFTIESEVLFQMLSKFLPVTDLHVEEIMQNPITQEKLKDLFGEYTPKPKRLSPKKVIHFKHPSGRTLQDFILEYMNNNHIPTVTWTELSIYAKKIGFHKSSINNGINRLIHKKLIQRVSSGTYKLMI